MAGKKINLTDQLKNYFGFDTFKGNQEAIIQNLLAGRMPPASAPGFRNPTPRGGSVR